MLSRSVPLCAALALLVLPAAAWSAAAEPGAVILSDGTQVPQIMPPGPLQLDNPQREQIRKAVLTEHTEVEFQLPETKPAKDFNPTVGAKLPSSLTPVGLPQPLLTQLPQLRNYDYLKVKNQVLIVNAMTHTIVDMFSETQPVT
jgi:hypothetical protein